MESKPAKPMESQKLIEVLFWLIKRFDNQRAAISTRAALVLSADTILLAGLIYFIDKILMQTSVFSIFDKRIIVISSTISFLLLISSLLIATNCIANVWKKSYQTVKENLLKRLLFYHRQTLEEFPKFSSFQKFFQEMTENQILTYGISDLWVLLHHHGIRYQNLRLSIKILTFSLVPFGVSFCIFLFKMLKV